jgi:hypothetical protein
MPATMTDFEHQCLTALVSEYGAAEIIARVNEIAAQLAEDKED